MPNVDIYCVQDTQVSDLPKDRTDFFRRLTDVFAEHGCPAHAVHINCHPILMQDYAIGGKPLDVNTASQRIFRIGVEWYQGEQRRLNGTQDEVAHELTELAYRTTGLADKNIEVNFRGLTPQYHYEGGKPAP